MLGDTAKADQFTPIWINNELRHLLMRHGLTIENVVELFPDVKSYQINKWHPNSKGAAENTPEWIRFIDENGNGFTLGSTDPSWGTWFTSWISNYKVYYESMYHRSFDEMKQWLNKAFKKQD